MTETHNAIGVLDRILSIVTAFADDSELTITQISARVALPKSTVHRLVAIMRERGLLEQSGHGFRLGLRLFEMGSRVPDVQRLVDIAQPYIRDLAETTSGTVHLAIPAGDDALYLSKFARRGAPVTPSRVGGRMPMHCTAVGKAMLAYSDDATVGRYLSRPLARRTRYTIVSPVYLRRDIERTRSLGIATEREECSLGLACIASPVVSDDYLLGALSVSFWTTRFSERDVLPLIRAAGRRLSADLASLPDANPARDWCWLRLVPASAWAGESRGAAERERTATLARC